MWQVCRFRFNSNVTFKLSSVYYSVSVWKERKHAMKWQMLLFDSLVSIELAGWTESNFWQHWCNTNQCDSLCLWQTISTDFFSCFLMFRECDTRIMNEIPFVLFVLFFICGDFYWNNLHRIDLLLHVKQNRVQHSIWWTMELPATNHLCTGAANRKYLN